MSLRNLIRPLVRKLHAYVPGEQPKVRNLVKLNTNENPWPPSPKVRQAMREAVDERLRLYPNPTAQPLREKLARLHKCDPGNIIVGNGSDELLALATRAFVEPVPFTLKGADSLAAKARLRCMVQWFHPSYSLYPVLTDTHGALANPVQLNGDFTIPGPADLRKRGWKTSAALSFVTTPNAPGGRGYSTAELDELCRSTKGIVILDEAYVDFADESAESLALRHPHVIVSRTFSKSYSLCFQRIGYFIAHPEIVGALDKVRDSYNVNGLGQVGALTTLQDLAYYRENFKRIKILRTETAEELTRFGFKVLPSQTNFLLVRPPRFAAKTWQQKLRDRKIIVRWFGNPDVKNYLRVTVGSPAEMKAFLGAVRKTLAE
jgi:histidinol-phosphate aminotransferase